MQIITVYIIGDKKVDILLLLFTLCSRMQRDMCNLTTYFQQQITYSQQYLPAAYVCLYV